jgi:ADP-heptose:LPS heptosyltransferase
MQKVLIIRFSSIGDIVLTTPLLRAIKAQKPATQIHYVTKKAYASVLEHNPHIDQLFLLDHSMKDLIRQLKNESYDLIIDLHKNLRSQRIKLVLQKPSVSFNKLNKEKWLMVRFKRNKLPQKHIVDRYFESLNKWGVQNDHQGLEYYNGCEKQLRLNGFEEFIKQKYIALVLGGTYYTKQIPEEKLNELIERLELPVVLLGGPTENELAHTLSERYPQKVKNAVGISSLNQSAELIRKSQFVITGDTGLMHIAAAYQKKIYSIWGNTIPEFGMSPYLPQKPENSIILQVENLNCRPCSKLGYNFCPQKHFNCMMQQDFSVIFKKQ